MSSTLRTRVTISVLAVIVVLVMAQTAYSVAAYALAVDERLVVEAHAEARAVAGDTLMQVAAWAGNTPVLEERLQAALKGDVVFAALVDARGVRALKTVEGFDPVAAAAAAIAGEHELGFGAAVERLLVAEEPIGDPADPAGVANSAGNSAANRAVVVDDLGLLDAEAVAAPRARESVARVVVGIDRAPTAARLLRHLAASMGLGLIAIVVAWILVRRVFLSLFARVEGIREVALAIADGDLTQRLDDGEDELGVVAGAVERVRRRWVTLVREMRAVAGRLGQASTQIQRDAADVATGSLLQLRAADDAKARTDDIVEQSARVARRVAAVAAASTESQQALKEAREGTRSVAARVVDMRRALDENEAHRGELGNAGARIVTALGGLSRAVDDAQKASVDVASRMAEADRTASAIASKAESALGRSGDGLSILAEQRRANDGVVAVTERTRVAASALSTSMLEVSSMAGLISDIADMTSMLSLNASIIAAQAGGQSLGFATVADEIRTLSARTRQASTTIAERMAEAHHQIDVVTDAVHGLSETVSAAQQTSGEATAVLESVLASMKGALEDAAGLARLIGDAAARTASVGKAVAQTSSMHENIHSALSEQQQAQLRLAESAATLRREADNVAALGAAEGARTDALLARAGKILAATDELVAASLAQNELAAAIAATTSSVRDVAHRHRDTVSAITSSVSDLNAQTRALNSVIRSLRIDESEA